MFERRKRFLSHRKSEKNATVTVKLPLLPPNQTQTNCPNIQMFADLICIGNIISLLELSFILLIYSEPVGSVGPKLTSGDKSRSIDIYLNGSVTLLCPAQSFPVPNFR